jgi:FMN phosphatase YigB (HAD superfamily)
MVDDIQSNIEAAKNLGMQGIIYHSFNQFRTKLNAIIQGA